MMWQSVPRQCEIHGAGTLQHTRTEAAVTLSPREQETLRWIATGLTQHQVANRMGVAPTTVDTYLKRIRQKLGPGNKAAILQRAVQCAGLVLDQR